MESLDEETLLSGQSKIWQLIFAFTDSMALKCAVELRIADIMQSQGAPLTLTQIASGIDSPSVDMASLERIMRFLVRKEIFSHHDVGGEALYGLTQNSRWLLRDSNLSLANLVLMEHHPLQLAPWHYLAECVKEGGTTAFNKAHGCDMREFKSQNPEFSRIFYDGLASAGDIVTRALLSHYKDGFDGIKSLVDVGGHTGKILAQIVKAHPHIKGINFDLPHVVANAPTYDGVSHVAGNMFEAIPIGDAVFMKAILHGWNDEDCVKILKNCRKAIPETTGRLIIVDIVLQPDGGHQFGDVGLVYDMIMFTHSTGGKERTELEWNKLLKQGGFPRYKIIEIPAVSSIIEAYPL